MTLYTVLEKSRKAACLPTHHGTEPTLDVAFKAFSRAVNLTAVKYKLVKEKGWDLDHAETIEAQYKAFLFLIGTKASATLVPTNDIDEMWHAHILDTRQYMTDCATQFGSYIHHYPYLGLKDEEDAARAEALFKNTRSLIAKTLGIRVGSYDLASCGGGCGGSSCGHSSCGSHSSCGGSHHSSCGGSHPSPSDTPSHTPSHTPTKNDDNGYNPLISSCSTSSDNSGTSIRRSPDRMKRKPSEPARPEKRRGIISRILGLLPAAEQEWYASVTPGSFESQDYRPDAKDLAALARTKTSLH